jgi:hypothetical protein
VFGIAIDYDRSASFGENGGHSSLKASSWPLQATSISIPKAVVVGGLLEDGLSLQGLFIHEMPIFGRPRRAADSTCADAPSVLPILYRLIDGRRSIDTGWSNEGKWASLHVDNGRASTTNSRRFPAVRPNDTFRNSLGRNAHPPQARRSISAPHLTNSNWGTMTIRTMLCVACYSALPPWQLQPAMAQTADQAAR